MAPRPTARSRATPASTNGHWRIRHDRIAETSVVTLRVNSRMHDRDIRIINPATGELLRELTLDPSRDYQPQKPQNALPKESEM